MEAVPRLPMIWFQLKVSPEPTTFGPKLKQYIQDFYNEEPESYNSEIQQLENLRSMAVRAPLDMAGCTLLKKYYCQLHFLQSRFPMYKDGPAAVTFTWRDAYANLVCSLGSIRFEIISILYNIGAMHTQLGARAERNSADGMKMACTHFQCAAWAFEHLKNSFPQPSGIDLSPELMTFMHQLSLAQAQECILEKSMLDNRKPTIVAKVAKQIVDYFTMALTTLEQGGGEDGTISDTVGNKIYKSWKRYVKFKKAYHMAVTYLYQGLAAEEQRKMGERVAFYNAALTSLNEAHMIYDSANVKEEKAAVEESLTFTNDVIEGKRKAAKNENDFIYHEEVPEKESLPTVKGASLVKGISFNINDPEVSGQDIFARFVPMKVHEANSLYSEEKAKILRLIGAKIDEKDQYLNTYLTSLKLEHMNFWDPDTQASEWECSPLPEELLERCAALNAKQHVIQDLVDIMGKLSETSQDVEKVLKEISKFLLEEEQKEKQYQDAVGKRPPSIVATDLTREAKKYEEAHNKACESNQALHKAVTMHVKNLKILAQPLADLMAQIPSPNVCLADQGSEKSQVKEIEKMQTKELKRVLNKVDEMRMQRLDLLTKLRDQIVQDDLTRLLVTATSESVSLDRLFADQLNKHQSLVSLIEQNLAAQDNILAALTDAYAQTANVRKSVEEVLKRREMTISSLINSYDAYEDLLAKSSKGLEFYRKLEINVSKLLQRVKSTCKVQEEEREQILAKDNKNTYEKVDATIPSTYDQARPRSGNGLKLKDYLNNRVESGTGYQNPYYNLYKGHVASMDSKSLTTDMGNKNVIQSPNTIPISEIPSSTVKSPQHYYPATYADYRTSSPYSYGTQTYYENLVANSILSQNYLPTTTNITNVYQQPTLSTSTAGISNSSVQYPASSYLPNGQTLPTATSQDKFHDVSSNYNVSNTLQYDAYQSPTGYNSYNITTPYVSNQETVKSGMAETSTHIQPVPQMPVVSTIGTAVVNSTVSTVDSQGQTSYNIVQQTQLYNNQQKTILNQEMFHNGQNAVRSQETMPVKDNTLTQNYSLPQNAQSEITYSQNYQNTTYYNPTELQAQHVPYTQSTYDTTVVPPTQYMQSQQPNTSNQSVHSVSSTNEASVSYSASLHAVNSVQYSQQTGKEPSKQNYTDKTYAAYGTQVQMNTVASNYPNTYQNYQHGTAGAPYEQTNMLPGDTSNTYAYINNSSSSEIIQSHAKPTTVQSYSQSYQYSQQVPYSGYVQYPNYSQGQNYAYMQNAHGSNTMAYTYNPANQAQGYTYASNPQGTQTSQTLEATVSVTSSDVMVSGIYQQQEINARYTNAGNNAVVSQTLSSQYSQVYQSQTGNDTYYTMPYGLQMQGQAGSVTRPDNYTNYNQTYMQAVNNGTNTTTSANPMKLTTKSEEPKSNVDLLSDLDITINHAPLVPEVKPLSTVQKKEQAIAADTAEDDKVEKSEQDKSCKTEQKVTTPTEDKNDHENLQIVWDTWYNDVQPKKDPLGEPAALQKFINDVEKYEKFVDSLLVKTLSGATNLDIKWKEVQDFEERENGKQSSTVALAHSSENRTIDCIPYDMTRVQISSSDVSSYINASHIMEITQWIPTAFIITQTPLIDKLDVFWTMIWEQESEIIACLASDAQLNGELYWPISEEDNLDIGNFTISLKKIVNHTTYIQRTLSIQHNKKKFERVIVHMQFLVWPSNGFPSSPGAILAFSSDVMTEQALRRCSPKPVIVHCLDGGSLSSLFLVAAATVCHIRADCGIVDVPLIFKGLAKCRKQVVNKESLLFAYRLVLYHAQDILMKRGILSSTRVTFDNLDGFKGNKEKTSRKLQCHPSDDFLHNLGVGMQRSDSEQSGKTQTILTNDSMSNKSSASQEKSNGRVIDPLSQLDPLWSIRR
ncbi:PREDICTED: tyrosine-protein phosphatase non-receptor type 23 isoform X2 [Atta colombica]|uniref:tyrosine-protein phosphatase non-receptor type 23 isoform X2 n=1 Tax=Atta colombica TaxID=520822 RepID=UPI00084C1CA1|nr:PREDICTED: tyrosine-protein phosphatase non-receptor type 23 isoform X2 [Atta colombica]